MQIRHVLLTFSLIGMPVGVFGDERSRTAPPLDFNRHIRPILSDKCFQCHGPDASHRQAELRLDDEQDAKRDRGGYRVIASGEVAQSELLARITASDPGERMPPADSGKQLSSAEIQRLKRWIDDGAPWAVHWAYVAPRRDEPVPVIKDSTWPVNWIDHYVLSSIERGGLLPAGDADPRTLVRRLYFDLIGLPPAPAEVDAFLADASPAAYNRIVDGLLESPHYGERMALYWLDLIRYADTVGYHGDQDHHISPYRDYVIDAFNKNLTFDQFTREQLAGDLLPNSTIDQKVASGYNRLLQTSHEGGVQPKEYLAMYAADRVRNVSAVWLGATMGCAQCHDHKYDPYTSKDFYSFEAFFADIDEAQHFEVAADTVPTQRPPEISVLGRHERARIATIDKEIARLKESPSDEHNKTLAALSAERESIEKLARRSMITVAIEPRTTRILPRGNWLDDSGPVVGPAVPQFLGSIHSAGDRPNRLDLANWLTDAQRGVGGLTARVFVNRMWYLLFGAGIARDLEDFGGQGQPPDHPELLDRLAVEFIDGGWNIKRLVKTIVLSRAYRQSSIGTVVSVEADPENRLFARQGRFRLPAEMVRDNALAISDLLVRELGGAAVKPYQPPGYYRHLNFPKREYHHDTDDGQWRRGVYVHWQRQFLHPTFKALDAPRREECTAERPRSNTPLAALALLNDPTFVEAARALAEQVIGEAGSNDSKRLDLMMRRAVSRTPDEQERPLLMTLLKFNRKKYTRNADAARRTLAVGQSVADTTIDVVELASWTAVARAILNMSETNTRT